MSRPVGETAMLMAAGLGTRMRPLTNDRPKPLIEVAGRTLIDRILDVLVAAGVRRAVINVHYLADMMEAHLARRTDIEILISDEREQLLETGGAIVRSRALLGDDPVLVVNTDAFWWPASTAPIDRLRATFNPESMDECLLLADISQSLGFDGPGDFFLEPDGRLKRRGEAPAAPFAYAGVRLMNPSLYDGLPEEPFSANRVWNGVIASGRLYGVPLEAFWLHVGDPDALKDADAHISGKAVT